MRFVRRLVPLCLLLVGVCGCQGPQTDETPRGALRLFLEVMDRSEWDEGALEDAYGLLSADARAALDARARLAGSLSGQQHEPWEMFPQGRFRLRFSPRREGGMRERIDGDDAVVVVTSASGERAEVPLVREEGGWRLVLHIPPVQSD